MLPNSTLEDLTTATSAEEELILLETYASAAWGTSPLHCPNCCIILCLSC